MFLPAAQLFVIAIENILGGCVGNLTSRRVRGGNISEQRGGCMADAGKNGDRTGDRPSGNRP